MNAFTLDYQERLPWNESATGVFDPTRLRELELADPKTLIKNLLETGDEHLVVNTMYELFRHGEGGTLIKLYLEPKINELWQFNVLPMDEVARATQLTGFFHEHEKEIRFKAAWQKEK